MIEGEKVGNGRRGIEDWDVRKRCFRKEVICPKMYKYVVGGDGREVHQMPVLIIKTVMSVHCFSLL